MKRYIYIIIGIVVVAVVAILVLLAIKDRTANSSLTISGATTTGSLPATGAQGGAASGSSTISTLGLPQTTTGSSSGATSGGQVVVQEFGVLSDTPVLDYFIDPKNVITAIEPTGQVIGISGGTANIINSSTIDGIISASFSYDGKKIVVSYGDPTIPKTQIFDATTNTWTSLQQNALSPQWSPINSYLLSYLAPAGAGKLAIKTINAANLKAAPSTLLTLNANDLTLKWPTQSEFILSDKPTLQSVGSILAFNSTAGTITPLVYEALGAEGLWSNNAAIPYGLIFTNNSSISAGNTTLQLQALSGSLPTRPLALSTLPSKCTFNTELMPIATSTIATTTSTATSTTTSTATSTAKKSTSPKTNAPTSTPYLALYCGIPRSSSGFSSARLPDDYNTMALFTSDDVYKINTATGAEQVLWDDAGQNMDVSDMKFFNNALFFINRYDNKLYGLTFAN